MFAAACTFEFGVGARISEVGYTGPRPKKARNHAILTREVRFHIQAPAPLLSRIVFSWELADHIKGPRDMGRVIRIEFNQDSAKNNRNGQPRDGIWMRNAGHFESQAMDVLIRFAVMAGAQEFLTWGQMHPPGTGASPWGEMPRRRRHASP